MSEYLLTFYCVVSAAVCGGVSLIELLHRYSHATKTSMVIWNVHALLYFLINFVVGAAAALAGQDSGLIAFDLSKDYPSIADIGRAVATGLIGLTLLRSSFATFRGDGGEDTNVGPAIVLDKIREILDTKIDLAQKLAADFEIAKIMMQVDPNKARHELPLLCLTGIKAATPQDVIDMQKTIDDICSSPAVIVRPILIGHALYRLCGIDVLRSAVTQLGEKIRVSANADATSDLSLELQAELASELKRLQQKG